MKPLLKTKLKVSKSAWNFCRSVATRYSASTEFAYLMLILAGEEVDCVVYGSTNVVGRTNEAQIRKCFKEKAPLHPIYLTEEVLTRVISKFGGGKLGFSLDRSFCQSTPQEIQEMINAKAARVLS